MKKHERKPGRPRKRINIERLRELREQGLSYRRIACRTGLATTTVYERLREHETEYFSGDAR